MFANNYLILACSCHKFTSGILTTTSSPIGSIGYYEKFVKYFVDNFTECRCGVSKQNMGRIIGGNYVAQVQIMAVN